MNKFSPIKRQWEVKYKSPSTGLWVSEVFDFEEDVDDFIENIGAHCDVQEIFG
jgi:hypothetical protein